MALHKLLFDTTDANTMADSANVGAYLRSADGTLLTHTDVGGKKALDVRVAEGINVEVDLDAADDSVAAWLNDGAGNAISSTGGALHISDAGGSLTVDATDFDIRDLTHVSDSVKVGDGTDFLAVNNDGSLNITDNGGSLTVDATDLDIRDLAFATDSVDVSGSSVSITGDVNVTQGTSPWVVSATDLDIRDITHVSDSIRLGDGTNLTTVTQVGADYGLDVNVLNQIQVTDAALANTAIATAANQLDVANTAEDVVASPLANRKYLFIYNNGNQDVYIGASGVSASNGFPLPQGSILELRAGAAVDIEWVGANTNQQLRTMELS